MKVKAIVTLKEGVLDPQGKAIQQTLNGMNFSEVKKILLFGDSLMSGYGLSEEYHLSAVLQENLKSEGYDIEVINGSISGDTSLDGLDRIEETLSEFDVDLIILGLGANDMLRRINPEQTEQNLEKIIKIIQNKKINISIKKKLLSKNGHYILGIENRLEQVIANLLDNSISFSDDNKKIEIEVEETSNNLVILIKDEGPGFSETSPQKIFKRFYSNRPDKFGQHSGLGLNIVKNLVELHKGSINASNRHQKKGANIEIIFPNS